MSGPKNKQDNIMQFGDIMLVKDKKYTIVYTEKGSGKQKVITAKFISASFHLIEVEDSYTGRQLVIGQTSIDEIRPVGGVD